MIIVQTNIDTRKEAEMIAKVLLRAKLVTVGHIHQVRSLYLWKGNLIEGKEFILNLKTHKEKLDLVMQEVIKLHTYEIPPVFVIPIIKSSQAYKDMAKGELKRID